MGMVVRTNTMAMNANRSLGINNSMVGKSLEKLSSGYRINRAADDASGLAISEKMKAQIQGLEQASANSQDGISLIQTAEGATQEIHNMLNRMVELATKSANGTIQNEVDREAIQQEVNDLNSEISRIASSADFNGIKLLDGSLSSGMSVDATLTDFNEAEVTFGNTAKISELPSSLTSAGTITIQAGANAATAGKVAVTIDDTSGNINITLDNASDKTYSSSEIVAAVRNKAEALLKAELAKPAADQEEDHIEIYEWTLGFTMSGDSLDVAAGDTTAGGTHTLADDAASNGGLKLQIGDTNDYFNNIRVNVDDLSAEALKLTNISVADQTSAGEAVDVIRAAINKVSTNRANLGAVQNRLEYTISNLDTTTENMSAANSRIRDTDMAEEMMEYTRQNVLTQAAQAMLAQANQQPQSILQLLQ